MYLYNKNTQSLKEVEHRDTIIMYTCGPTVYGDAHIGNMRSFVVADMLRRWMESDLRLDSPPTVKHIMNITDVGHLTEGDIQKDKMVMQAKVEGKTSTHEIAEFYKNRFIEDAKSVNIKVAIEYENDPSVMPMATSYIQEMIEMIQSLVESSNAYVTPSGVFFDVSTFSRHGEVSGNKNLEGNVSGKGGRVSKKNMSVKHSDEDFLLWKIDPNHMMKWASPWGHGYPGWHIECSAMAVANGHSDKTGIIDIHTGGEDNAFPHHEAENAQSCCSFDSDPNATVFTRHWLHVSHLNLNSQKMSKSFGDFARIKSFIDKGASTESIRLYLISTHYRKNLSFSGINSFAPFYKMIEKWRNAKRAIVTSSGFLREFKSAMDKDLNVPEAIGAINKHINHIDENTWNKIEIVFGINGLKENWIKRELFDYKNIDEEKIEQVERLISIRHKARVEKKFDESDRARCELLEMGVAIEDAPNGRYLAHNRF